MTAPGPRTGTPAERAALQRLDEIRTEFRTDRADFKEYMNRGPARVRKAMDFHDWLKKCYASVSEIREILYEWAGVAPLDVRQSIVEVLFTMLDELRALDYDVFETANRNWNRGHRNFIHADVGEHGCQNLFVRLLREDQPGNRILELIELVRGTPGNVMDDEIRRTARLLKQDLLKCAAPPSYVRRFCDGTGISP